MCEYAGVSLKICMHPMLIEGTPSSILAWALARVNNCWVFDIHYCRDGSLWIHTLWVVLKVGVVFQAVGKFEKCICEEHMPGSGMCFGGKRCEKGQWRPIPWMKIIPFTKPLMEQSSLGLVWRQEEKAVQRVFSFQESWRGRRGPNMWPTLKTWSSFKTIQRCTSPKVVDKLHDAYKVKPVWLYKNCTSLWDNVTYPPPPLKKDQ